MNQILRVLCCFALLGFFALGCKSIGKPKMASRSMPPIIEAGWLTAKIGQPGVKVIDVRPLADYSSGHIPGSLSLNIENLRGNVGGIPSMLLPAPILAEHFSLMGIEPSDAVILVYGERPMDATLVTMALERLGHANYAILDGGFGAWKKEHGALATTLPKVARSHYPAPRASDEFTADAEAMNRARLSGEALLDVRPKNNFAGGHIPGAKNRVFSDDLASTESVTRFKDTADLEAAYRAIVPDKNAPVYVSCRTGHSASQTFFVLHRLLGYKNVRWYDASWTEWSARPDLPVARE